MQVDIYRGGCLCGALRYEAAGSPATPCFCHCRSCRLAAGAPMVPWATFTRRQFRITHGTLSERRSSAGVWRGFCAHCGSALTYRNEARETEIDVTLATLDEPAAIAPQMHLWVAEKLPWLTLRDGLPQFPAGVGSGGA
jgi:hypothetical protein